MAAIERENTHGENGSSQCAGTTKAGDPCRSKPSNGSDYCLFHAEDHREVSQRGGQVSAARRSVRERFRQDAERIYNTLWHSLVEAVDSEVTRWGDCPNCKHRVPVTFPDIRARTDAIRTMLDQGYGRPAESVRVSVDVPSGTPWDGLAQEQKEELLRQVKAELARRKAMTPEEHIADMETKLAEAKARLASSNGQAA